MGYVPTCNDSRPCFGKYSIKDLPDKVLCNCLNAHAKYKDGECPFCKPEREVTNGKIYPYNKNYGRLAI